MNSVWYNVTVILLWLATMGWLISQKVAPALLVGDPPNYRTIVEAQREDPQVGWEMRWNGQPVGWAVTITTPLPSELTEVRSLVHFDDLPIREMVPPNLRALLFSGVNVPNSLQFEAKSRVTFDPLKRLSQFESAVGFQGIDSILKVRGAIDGTRLNLTVHTDQFNYDTEVTLPRESMLSDALSPQPQLPGLREGQTWTIEVYSPLRPPNNPMEIVRATVEGTERVPWQGRTVETWLVVYRNDPGSGTHRARKPRGKLWVRDDGTVIRQQAMLFDSTMTFVRMAPAEAARLANEVGDWD